MNTERRAVLGEILDEGGEVFIRKERTGVVNEGGGGRAGAKAVVAVVMSSAAVISSLLEERVQGFEELEQNQAREDHRERVALREAFFLGKIVEGAVGSGKVTVVGGGVH